ncbi:hypothetical protein V6N11_084043 [Hibiscus sabdariffa]|uniref:RNase H type-1 domain-containing protein n=1 Tax=Hibiscus sabdariffa TaxID=183260 RepID=A0ABR2QDS2_9ROSI
MSVWRGVERWARKLHVLLVGLRLRMIGLRLIRMWLEILLMVEHLVVFSKIMRVVGVILEVDSAYAVAAMHHQRKGRVRVPILTQVMALLDMAWEVQVCRIPRQVNRVADGLAKIARLDSLKCEYFEVPPAGIDALLLLDALEAGLD